MKDIKDISIPPLPNVILKVVQYDHTAPTANPQDIEKIIAPDKGITAEILKVANSAYYGRSGKIKLLRDATALLGLKALKNLIIFLGTKGLNEKIKNPTVKKYTNLLPIVSALLAQEIAKHLNKKEIVEEVFLAALLHKLGITVLAINKGDHYAFLLEQAEQDELDIIELEKSAYGITQVEIGRHLATEWKLPEVIVRCCGISTNTKIEELQSDIEKITFIASICGMELLHIPFDPSNFPKANSIFQQLGGKGDAILLFANEQTFENLKQHPFYQLSSA